MSDVNKKSFEEDVDSLRMTLDNLPQGVCVTDSKGDFLFVNNTLCYFLGYPHKVLSRFNAHNMITDGMIDENLISDVLLKKKSITKYLDVLRSDGTKILLMQTERPIFDANGNVIYGISVLRDVVNEQRLYTESQNRQMNFANSPKENYSSNLVYQSDEMQEIIDNIDPLCSTDVPILLQGGSGTGKEVLANYIHKNSNRSNKSMVCINCAAIPETLLESELFGYEKGAFTGADPRGKLGLLESAQGSTVFLDEINSLPLYLQPKLLRVLETGTVLRVGGSKPKHIDFRLIIASNKDLAQCVSSGDFRMDLFYRINGFTINIPPLAKRKADIIPLANSFLSFFCRKYVTEKFFSPSVYEQLLSYDWPGNVRELRNVVERVVLTSASSVRVINAIPDSIVSRSVLPEDAHAQDSRYLSPRALNERTGNTGFSLWDRTKSLGENLEYYESAILREAYERCGNVTRMAEALGINQSTASRKLAKYAIAKRA